MVYKYTLLKTESDFDLQRVILNTTFTGTILSYNHINIIARPIYGAAVV